MKESVKYQCVQIGYKLKAIYKVLRSWKHQSLYKSPDDYISDIGMSRHIHDITRIVT